MINYKKIAVLLIIICTFIQFTIAKADTNMDGGGSGGGSNNGTSSNFYSSGDDGVRITVIDIRTKGRAMGTNSIDYYRKNKEGKKIIHFGKNSKLEYMGISGYTLDLIQSSIDYKVITSNQTVAFETIEMPTIVSSSSSTSNIDKIKNYFNDEARLKVIASRVGISYDEMTNGNYKIIFEPMIYITFEGNYIAMTAHEVALLDMATGGSKTTGGQIRSKFVSFSHKNLPLSIFLQKKDLGINRWTGGKNVRVSNGEILSSLGIGILSFEPPGSDVDVEGADYTYRPNTDVITAVKVGVSSYGYGATVDAPISVSFSGPYIGTMVVTGIVIPPGGERLVWIKWRTPNTTEKIKTSINVNIVGGNQAPSSTTVTIKINPIVEYEPPNPTADDTKPYNWSDTLLPTFPKIGALYGFSSPVTSRSWHTYTCTKRSVWTGDYYTDEHGEYIENEYGYKIPIYETVYDFTRNDYTASLTSTTASIKPDAATNITNTSNSYIKSGYGIEMKVNSKISATVDGTTGMQTAVVYFPEFKYKVYRRISYLPGASLNSTLEFPINLYSINGNRIHFLPIWFPDKEYKVYIETLDAWTPAGMLCNYTTANINVKGSMWDDWHIGVVPEFNK